MKHNIKRLALPLAGLVLFLGVLVVAGGWESIIRMLAGGVKLFFAFIVAHLIWETFFPYFRLGASFQNRKTEPGTWRTIAIFRVLFIMGWLIAFALVI